MTDIRKAAEMALERLESHEYWMDEEAIKALRQALAQSDEVLAEREACAKVCDDNAKEWIDGNNDWCQGQAVGSNDCAAAIRARG